MKNTILETHTNNPHTYSKRIKADPQSYTWLCERTSYLKANATVSERVYNVVHDLSSVPQCSCGAERKYIHMNRGYADHCSATCMGKTKHRFTEKTYKELLSTRDLEILGPYVNITTHVRHRCLKCRHEWDKTPTTLANQKQGCPKCQHRRTTKTHEQYVSELPDDIELLGTYINAKVKISHRHDCGYVWDARPNDILTGYGCPDCNIKGSFLGTATQAHGRTFHSMFEADCAGILIERFGLKQIEFQKKYLPGRRLTCDFYIVKHDLWIEASTMGVFVWYREKIEFKRSLVSNFYFAETLEGLRERLNALPD